MNAFVLTALISGLAAAILIAFLASKIRTAPADGKLSFGWDLALLGWGCTAIVAYAGWAFFFDQNVQTDRTQLLAAIALVLGFGLGAIYFLGEYFKVRGTYDDNGIDFVTPWTGRKTEKWTDLQSASFASIGGWHALSFKSGATIRISSFLRGNSGVLAKLGELGYDL